MAYFMVLSVQQYEHTHQLKEEILLNAPSHLPIPFQLVPQKYQMLVPIGNVTRNTSVSKGGIWWFSRSGKKELQN